MDSHSTYLRAKLLKMDVKSDDISWKMICATLNKGSIPKSHLNNIYMLILEHYIVAELRTGNEVSDVVETLRLSQSKTKRRDHSGNLPFKGSTIAQQKGALFKVENLPLELQKIIRGYLISVYNYNH